MTMSVTVEEAASTLADLLDRVSRGEEITIIKEGQAIARLLPASQQSSLPPILTIPYPTISWLHLNHEGTPRYSRPPLVGDK